MNVPGLEKAAALILLVVGSQIWSRWRVAAQTRTNANRVIFNLVALETALAPRQEEGDDPQVLEDLREIVRRRNHMGDASALQAELAQWVPTQGPEQQETLRRAFARLEPLAETQFSLHELMPLPSHSRLESE